MNFIHHESRRGVRFEQVWVGELDEVFADVARYYDKANYVASLGLWGYFRRRFLSIIVPAPGLQILDLCAGTNAIGIALARREPSCQVVALDRSPAMQEVGREKAGELDLDIPGTIGDAHYLPFPDNSFDIVTLQFASRHLRILEVVKEVRRVLKPGGWFYHSDMLRPDKRVVATTYYAYLRGCLALTAMIFRSNRAARNCKAYFLHTLKMFYTADEFTELLRLQGFQEVSSKTVFGGMLGFHKARNP